MGFWDRVKAWVAGTPAPATRSVGALHDDALGVDQLEEVVEAEGGPLKPRRLRLIRRDRRLLPKPERKRGAFGSRAKRPKLMAATEARRLFGSTLRTRDRNIRDLIADEAQLNRYGLPIWRDEVELAKALDLSLGQLRFFSIHRSAESVSHYFAFTQPKRGGGERLIMAPKRRLKAIQRELVRRLISKLPVSEYAHGFQRGRSVKTGAAPHVGKAILLKMDLANFFPTVSFARIRGFLIALGYGYTVASVLAALMTEAERQPVEIDGRRWLVPIGPRVAVQGAPTSPGILNAITLRLDRRLAGLARSQGFVFTRYADDLTFSGDDPSKIGSLLRTARKIIEEEGFAVQRKKTRVCRRAGRQQVTGVTVNRVLGLSRRERRVLRAMIHRLKTGRAIHPPVPDGKVYLAGKLAYLAMLNAEQASALRGSR